MTHWWAASLFQKQWNRSGPNNWLDCLACWYTPRFIFVYTVESPWENLGGQLFGRKEPEKTISSTGNIVKNWREYAGLVQIFEAVHYNRQVNLNIHAPTKLVNSPKGTQKVFPYVKRRWWLKRGGTQISRVEITEAKSSNGFPISGLRGPERGDRGLRPQPVIKPPKLCRDIKASDDVAVTIKSNYSI